MNSTARMRLMTIGGGRPSMAVAVESLDKFGAFSLLSPPTSQMVEAMIDRDRHQYGRFAMGVCLRLGLLISLLTFGTTPVFAVDSVSKSSPSSSRRTPAVTDSPSKGATIWAAVAIILAGGLGLSILHYRRRVLYFREQLEIANGAIQTAQRAKTTFFTSISHEVRTPLNAVLGLTSLLLDTPLSPEQRNYLRMIRGSGNSLLSFLDNVLNYSRIESQLFHLEFESFSIRDRVESALEAGSLQADNKSIEFAAIIEPDIPEMVIGDPDRFSQILGHLISNAVKYTDRGEIVVKIFRLSSSSVEPEGRGALAQSAKPCENNEPLKLGFEVNDTGSGIRSDCLEDLFRISEFDPKLDSWRKDSQSGPGFGLAICRKLCQMMDGDLRLVRTSSEGSFFSGSITVTLATKVAISRLFTSSEEIGVSPLCGKQFIVLTATESMREALRVQLEFWLANLVDFDEEDALEWISQGASSRLNYDALILDLQIPRASVFIRAFGKQAPIIGLAAAGKQSREPVDVILPKPVRSPILLATLASVVDGRRSTSFSTRLGSCPEKATPGFSELTLGGLSEEPPPAPLSRIDVATTPSLPLPLAELRTELETKPIGQHPTSEAISAKIEAVSQSAPFRVASDRFAVDNPLRILIVEDIELNRRLVRAMLKRMGYEADVAVNGKEAVGALIKKDYDVVFMDIQMPVMNGLDATRQIRQLPGTVRQPIIVALTANAMAQDRQDCLKAGMDHFLSKPICLPNMVLVLRNASAQIQSISASVEDENSEPVALCSS